MFSFFLFLTRCEVNNDFQHYRPISVQTTTLNFFIVITNMRLKIRILSGKYDRVAYPCNDHAKCSSDALTLTLKGTIIMALHL